MARNAMGTRRATSVNSGETHVVKGTPAERHQEFRNVADMLRYVKGPMSKVSVGSFATQP